VSMIPETKITYLTKGSYIRNNLSMDFSNSDRDNLERLVGKCMTISEQIKDISSRIDTIEDRIEAYFRNPLVVRRDYPLDKVVPIGDNINIQA
jgi:hypothetical protein